jgi:phosphoglycolate phosphatase/putative hydrolase of the HAD superfamily
MEIYSLPSRLTAIILDIDRTLYDHDEYADGQLESQYRKLAEHWSVREEEARERVRSWREEYARNNGGKTQSLGNTFAALGVPIETSAAWRNATIRPEEYLERDERLVAALEELARGLPLMAVTNNPVAVGQATLRVLGVGELVRDVVGLDTTLRSKPDTEPFLEALRRLGMPAAGVISVGDRYDVDIAPALALGMGAIRVGGVAEVYELPEALRERGLVGASSLD